MCDIAALKTVQSGGHSQPLSPSPPLHYLRATPTAIFRSPVICNKTALKQCPGAAAGVESGTGRGAEAETGTGAAAAAAGAEIGTLGVGGAVESGAETGVDAAAAETDMKGGAAGGTADAAGAGAETEEGRGVGAWSGCAWGGRYEATPAIASVCSS